jgi:hypothetical protein
VSVVGRFVCNVLPKTCISVRLPLGLHYCSLGHPKSPLDMMGVLDVQGDGSLRRMRPSAAVNWRRNTHSRNSARQLGARRLPTTISASLTSARIRGASQAAPGISRWISER